MTGARTRRPRPEFRTPFWVVGTRAQRRLSRPRRNYSSLARSHSLCLRMYIEVCFFISPVVQRTRLITFGARTGLRARLWSISLCNNLPQCSSFAQSRRRTPHRESVCVKLHARRSFTLGLNFGRRPRNHLGAPPPPPRCERSQREAVTLDSARLLAEIWKKMHAWRRASRFIFHLNKREIYSNEIGTKQHLCF